MCARSYQGKLHLLKEILNEPSTQRASDNKLMQIEYRGDDGWGTPRSLPHALAGTSIAAIQTPDKVFRLYYQGRDLTTRQATNRDDWAYGMLLLFAPPLFLFPNPITLVLNTETLRPHNSPLFPQMILSPMPVPQPEVPSLLSIVVTGLRTSVSTL